MCRCLGRGAKVMRPSRYLRGQTLYCARCNKPIYPRRRKKMEPTAPPAPPPTMVIQRFGDRFCPVCTSMKKAMTLEKFIATKQNIRLEDYDLELPINEEKADELGIGAIPAFVVLDGEGNIVLQQEGGLNATGLEKMYQKALKNIENGELGSQPRRSSRRRAARR